jgi:poly(A) polymerase
VLIPDVPPALLSALRRAAGQHRLALVGGVVRDLLLHRHHQDPWRGLPDLDLVFEGQAAELVDALLQEVRQVLGSAVQLRARPHGRFGTVEVELDLPAEQGGTWLLDLASARCERYTAPACSPTVRPGTLEEDLARRDFSVNAMALVLSASPGDVDLLDPHGGQADLASRSLRLLHGQSFQDDPTRLVRAARYAARLGFDLDAESLSQVHTTLDRWPWCWRLGDPPEQVPPALGTRLHMELELLLEREPWRLALQALQRWRGLTLLDPGLQSDRHWRRRLAWGARVPLPLLLVLVSGATDPLALARRLQLPQRQQQTLTQATQLRKRLHELARSSALPAHPSGWCELLEAPGLQPQAVALAMVMGAQPRRALLHWWARWRHVVAPLSATALLEQGWLPGPTLGSELRRLRAQCLDARETDGC